MRARVRVKVRGAQWKWEREWHGDKSEIKMGAAQTQEARSGPAVGQSIGLVNFGTDLYRSNSNNKIGTKETL